MTIKLLAKQDITETLQLQIATLYTQLSSNIEQLPVKELLADDVQLVFAIAYVDKKVVGMAMMALYKVISGYKGMIEDVVVDKAYRGKGIGRKIMEALLDEGKKYKAE